MNHEYLKTGIGWYSKEQWPEYCRIMEDKVDETHEIWLRSALELEKTLMEAGVKIIRVPIDLDDFELWCKLNHKKRIKSERAEYVALKVRSL